MIHVASRELRNQTREILAKVEAGEDVTITVNGRPVALLVPVPYERPWMPRDEFIRLFLIKQADSGLRAELRELAPDDTDSLSPLD